MLRKWGAVGSGTTASTCVPAARRPTTLLGLLVAGAVALGALLVWSLAWGTGLQRSSGLPGPDGWPISAIRYMLPAVGAALMAVALATRVPGPAGRVATALLVAALGWSLVADARLGAPYTPSVHVLALGAFAGLLVYGGLVLAGRRTPRRVPPKTSTSQDASSPIW